MAKVVFKVGDDVSTDIIYPGRFMATVLPTETPQFAFIDYPEFNAKIKKNEFPPQSIIVAGKNFGCGSSREHAPIALKAAGIAGVIAGSFARIFYRNAFNMGLAIFECPEAAAQIKPGQEISVDMDTGVITDLTTGKKYPSQAIPPFMQKLLSDGGLMAFVNKHLEAKSA